MPRSTAVPTPCPPLDPSARIYALAPGQFLADCTTNDGGASADVLQAQAGTVLNLIDRAQAAAANQQMQMMAMDVPFPGDGGDGGTNSYTFNGSSYTLPDYGTNLYLQCLAISNNALSGLIHNSSMLTPYALLSKQSLTLSVWSPEATFYGSGVTNFSSFAVSKFGRDMLFLRARVKFCPAHHRGRGFA